MRQFSFGDEYAGSWSGLLVRHLYVRAGLGLGHAIRLPYEISFDPGDVEQGAWGPAATLCLGWMPLKARGGSLGVEVSDSVVVYQTGRRHNWAANLTVQLDVL